MTQHIIFNSIIEQLFATHSDVAVILALLAVKCCIHVYTCRVLLACDDLCVVGLSTLRYSVESTNLCIMLFAVVVVFLSSSIFI
jgi:hypothetical protein